MHARHYVAVSLAELLRSPFGKPFAVTSRKPWDIEVSEGRVCAAADGEAFALPSVCALPKSRSRGGGGRTRIALCFGHRDRPHNFFEIPAKKPRRIPNCGANTPIPEPSLSS